MDLPSALQAQLQQPRVFIYFLYYLRGVNRKFAEKRLPFLHRMINRGANTAHNTATHMQLIGYNMLGVNRLRALQLSSRQRYIARTSPFYVAF